ncbi:hypothetical protein [Tichowtungia aerotolerans]|uniref:DUF4064 domain-containing protein n=1 Tax=Tichowtungia aerotolerans TaxID=2697043 RepID=A0A6P1M899_9BACT|nr:hypothetical protein [Tichowtungia aerotolerans]QHI68597.1 hypothetical protein GT409_03740 [Tichowtungia aerotolerans]QHI68744.1 hypothetical protein GT409_04530 [Tichowtungia aerotolerans]
MKMEKHLHRLGTVYIAFGWIGIAAALLFIPLTIKDIQRLLSGTGQPDLQSIVFMFIGASLLILVQAIFHIFFGKAVRMNRKWATRVVGFIIGVLLLFQFPIGTVIGGYTLWVLAKLDQSILMEPNKSSDPT